MEFFLFLNSYGRILSVSLTSHLTVIQPSWLEKLSVKKIFFLLRAQKIKQMKFIIKLINFSFYFLTFLFVYILYDEALRKTYEKLIGSFSGLLIFWHSFYWNFYDDFIRIFLEFVVFTSKICYTDRLRGVKHV